MKVNVMKKQMKRCPRCKRVLPLDQFTSDRSRKDELCYLCRECKRLDTREYYKRHPEAIVKQSRLYRSRHPEIANARSRRWNHEHRRGYSVAAILELYGDKCHLCSKEILPEHFSVDHVIPLSLGGSDELSNLRPAHRSCNSSKGNRI